MAKNEKRVLELREKANRYDVAASICTDNHGNLQLSAALLRNTAKAENSDAYKQGAQYIESEVERQSLMGAGYRSRASILRKNALAIEKGGQYPLIK